MPVPLITVRVLLVLWTGIVALVYFFALVGLGVVEPAWFERQTGLTRGVATVLTVAAALRLPFTLYVAVVMGRGGPRTRLLVRVAVALGLLFAVVDWFNGVNPVLAVAVLVLVLVLNELGPSRRWYAGAAPVDGADPAQGG